MSKSEIHIKVSKKSDQSGIPLSVIIPVLNERENLEFLIPILLEEDKFSGEVIIVDSVHSTDNISECFSDEKVVILESRKSQRAYQLNLGARYARYPILFFIHADMRPPRGFYIHILNHLIEVCDAGCFSYRFTPSNPALDWLASHSEKNGPFSGGGDQGLFLHRHDFQLLGGYDQSLQIMEDFDFYRRLRKAGLSFRVIPDNALVSSRKYKKNSFLRVILVQLMVFLLFRVGLPQSWQIWLYRHGLVHD